MPGGILLKVGGRALEADGALAELAAEIAGLAEPVVIVHGGGSAVTGWCRRLGIEPRFHDGLRVTDADTLDVAVAVLAGLANKQLVAGLRHAGLHAAGLSLADGGLVAVCPHPQAARLGAVGQVGAVNGVLLRALLDAGITPVVASIGAHEGLLLNVNADDAAAVLAIEWAAAHLILISDVEGLNIDGRRVPAVSFDELPEILEHPDVAGGMKPKLRGVAAALAAGVGQVHIGAWRGAGSLTALIDGRGTGTTFSRSATEEYAR